MIVEGAGSPAEVNLRRGDIANMGFARTAGVPVVLAGDIDRGGVIAQLVGTQAVIDPEDAAMIAGFLVNKFRGDVRLFDEGYRLIEARTGWRGYGVVPFFPEAALLPAEDALDLGRPTGQGALTVAWLAFSRVANFDDLDPLKQEPGLTVRMVRPGQPIPAEADLVILPGTKSTRGDLAFLRAQGWDVDLRAHHRRGGRVLGICGGYQMLGRSVADPEGLEGAPGVTEGLGLLDVETVMHPDKRLTRVAGRHRASGAELTGYEIHIGATEGPEDDDPKHRSRLHSLLALGAGIHVDFHPHRGLVVTRGLPGHGISSSVMAPLRGGSFDYRGCVKWSPAMERIGAAYCGSAAETMLRQQLIFVLGSAEDVAALARSAGYSE